MKKDIEDKSTELKDLIAKEDADPAEIDKKTGELSEHLQKIGQEAYKDAGAQQGAPNAEAGEQPKEEGKKDEKKDVEEGEVVE